MMDCAGAHDASKVGNAPIRARRRPPWTQKPSNTSCAQRLSPFSLLVNRHPPMEHSFVMKSVRVVRRDFGPLQCQACHEAILPEWHSDNLMRQRRAVYGGTGTFMDHHPPRTGPNRPAVSFVEELQRLRVHKKQGVAEPLYAGL